MMMFTVMGHNLPMIKVVIHQPLQILPHQTHLIIPQRMVMKLHNATIQTIAMMIISTTMMTITIIQLVFVDSIALFG